MQNITLFLEDNPYNFLCGFKVKGDEKAEDIIEQLIKQNGDFLMVNDLLTKDSLPNFHFVHRKHKGCNRTPENISDYFVKFSRKYFLKSRKIFMFSDAIHKDVDQKPLFKCNNVFARLDDISQLPLQNDFVTLPIIYIKRNDHNSCSYMEYFCELVKTWKKKSFSLSLDKRMIKLYRGFRDYMGRSLLHYACLCENFTVFKFLLQEGYDLHYNDCGGLTPLRIIGKKFNKKFINYLHVHFKEEIKMSNMFDKKDVLFYNQGPEKIKPLEILDSVLLSYNDMCMKFVTCIKAYLTCAYPNVKDIIVMEGQNGVHNYLKVYQMFLKRNITTNENLKVSKLILSMNKTLYNTDELTVSLTHHFTGQIDLLSALHTKILEHSNVKFTNLNEIFACNNLAEEKISIDNLFKFLECESVNVLSKKKYEFNIKITSKVQSSVQLSYDNSNKLFNLKIPVGELMKHFLVRHDFELSISKIEHFRKEYLQFIVNRFSSNVTVVIGKDVSLIQILNQLRVIKDDFSNCKFIKHVHFKCHEKGEHPFVIINETISFSTLSIFTSALKQLIKVDKLCSESGFTVKYEFGSDYVCSGFKLKWAETFQTLCATETIKRIMGYNKLSVVFTLKLNNSYKNTIELSKVNDTLFITFTNIERHFNMIGALENSLITKIQEIDVELYLRYFLTVRHHFTPSELIMRPVAAKGKLNLSLSFYFNSFKCVLPSRKVKESYEIVFHDRIMKFLLNNSTQTIIVVANGNRDYTTKVSIKIPKTFSVLMTTKEKLKWIYKLKSNSHSSIIIDRNDIFGSSFSKLNHNLNWKDGNINVKFSGMNEIGTGEGIAREWFMQLQNEMFRVKGLFSCINSFGDINISRTYVNEEMAKFCGIIIGRSILYGKTMTERFSYDFVKRMLGEEVTFDDVEMIDKVLYKHMNYIRNVNKEKEIEDMSLNFVINLDGVQVNLKENGSKLDVTNKSKEEYIKAYISKKYENSTKAHLSIMRGIHSVIPKESLIMFTAKELQHLMFGDRKIDLSKLKSDTKFTKSSSISENEASNVENWFWKLMSEKGELYKSRILQFISGLVKIPLGGFQRKLSICVYPYVKGKLPTAHTCSYQMELPAYKSKSEMDFAFETIIKNGGYVGFMFV